MQKQARRITLFPTYLYELDEVLGSEGAAKMAQFAADNLDSSSLHTRPETAELVASTEQMTAMIVESMSWQIERTSISSMWSNLNRQGDVHLPHTHSNNLLSGVYYPRAAHSSSIEFVDPRPAAAVLQPEVKTLSPANAEIWPHQPKDDTMIVFPSWLMHYVPRNTSDEPRTSIAFNIQIEGRIGSSMSLQTADFG